MNTVEQLKMVTPPAESPWHFLAQLPFTQEAEILYMLILGGMVGAGIHYVTRWAKGEIKGSLIAYMFIDNPRRSVLSVLCLVGELSTELGSGMFMHDGIFIGWPAVLIMGAKTGFMIDSIVNKGTRPEWTPEQRVEVQADPQTPTAVQPTINTGDANANAKP